MAISMTWSFVFMFQFIIFLMNDYKIIEVGV